MLTTSMLSSEWFIEGVQLHCMVADDGKLKIIDKPNRFLSLPMPKPKIQYKTCHRFSKALGKQPPPLVLNQGLKRPDKCECPSVSLRS